MVPVDQQDIVTNRRSLSIVGLCCQDRYVCGVTISGLLIMTGGGGRGEQKGFFWVNEMHRDFFTVCVRFGRMLRKVGIFWVDKF